MSDLDYWNNRWAEVRFDAPNSFAKRAWVRIRPKNFKTLLDLGCGDGRDSVFFHSKGLEVTAVDISESGIGKLKVREPEIRTIQQGIETVDFSENSFDIIYAHLSLHYFTDAVTTEIFKKLYFIVKDGGLLFVKCKSIDDPLYGEGEKIENNMYRRDHVRHFFSKEYMREKLESFKILSLRKTSSIYHKDKSSMIEAIATK